MDKIKSYETLQIVRAQLEHVVFKEFFKNYDLPKGLKQVHAMTIIKLFHIKKVSMSELSYALNMEKSSITSISDKLHDTGFIYSERSKEDRRVYHLKLTEEGLEFAKKLNKDHNKYLDTVFEELDDETNKKLFESVDFIAETFLNLSVIKKFFANKK
jgi:DNA-binding MarR family transcriptional regulator